MASFNLHVDALDVHDNHIAVGLSSLEGDVWDGGLHLLSADDGQTLHSIHCDAGISSVRFVGKQKDTLACACDDGTVKLYDLTLELLNTIEAHDDITSTVLPLHASNHMTSAGWDGVLKVWDLAHHDVALAYQVNDAHFGAINDLTACPTQNQTIASVGNDGFLRIWDMRIPAKEGCVSIFGHDQAVSCAEWNIGLDNVIYTGTDAGDVFTLDTRYFKEGGHYRKSSIHKARVRKICSLATHRELILSCSDDTSIMISGLELQESFGQTRDILAR